VLGAIGAALLAGCSVPEGGPEGDAAREPVAETAQWLRPDSPGNNELFHFEPGDVVETHASKGGSFLVHFTRSGPNAVPAADSDATGIPDFVEEVAAIYDEVLDLYQGKLGFRAPPSDEAVSVDNGGDGRFDVYLVDFNGVGDGVFRPDGCLKDKPQICAGYMVQENDYKNYGYPSTTIANRILGSHEFFHAVQAAYDGEQDSVIREGTAVWATEKFDPSLKDFEAFIDGYLDNTDRTLNQPLPGPVDPFSYGSAIFFQFLDERYGEGIIRAMWERCEDGAEGVPDPYWYDELTPLLKSEAGSSFSEALIEFATWNLYTGSFADPAKSYDAGSGYPRVKMNDVTEPLVDEQLRVFQASYQYYRMAPGGRSAITAAVVPPKDAPAEAEGLQILLAVERGSAIESTLKLADPLAGTETVNVEGAEGAVVVVINTLQEGQSRRPGLCIGTAAEVDACRKTLVPPDIVPMPDDDTPKPPPPDPEAEESGGCSMSESAAPPGGAALTALAGFLCLYSLYRRRRRLTT
jgi:hypothetical protein